MKHNDKSRRSMVAFRRLRRFDRWAALPGVILGTILGWAIWLGILGPVLLP